MSVDNNRLVVRGCYWAMFIQAMVINLTPLLFIPLKDQLGLTFEQVGRLILINFLIQMVVDLVCCALADRVSTKLLMVIANLLSGVGLWVFALAPAAFATPYDGLVLGTVVFSIGCGLLEVLISPIINAVPSARKAGDMALLHACYPIGKVAVIIVTGLALQLVGVRHWRWIMLAWSVVPILNTVVFLLVRLPPLATAVRRQPLRELVCIPAYRVAVVALLFAGATELTLAQWTSAYAEKGLGCPKAVADLVGFGLFGAGMIAGRLWFGFKGEVGSLYRLMMGGALWSAAMYVVISLAPWPALSLAACATAGFSVSLLWPGVLSLTAARFPLAGGSMFALLAAAGDAGGGLAPWGVGVIADHAAGVAPWLSPLFSGNQTAEQLGLRAGLLAAMVYPLIMALLLAWMRACDARPPGATTGAV